MTAKTSSSLQHQPFMETKTIAEKPTSKPPWLHTANPRLQWKCWWDLWPSVTLTGEWFLWDTSTLVEPINQDSLGMNLTFIQTIFSHSSRKSFAEKDKSWASLETTTQLQTELVSEIIFTSQTWPMGIWLLWKSFLSSRKTMIFSTWALVSDWVSMT